MITINLFDENYRQAGYSVLGKTPQHIRYVRDRMDFDGITLFTDEYINSPIVDQVKSKYKIGWLHEPYCLHPKTYRHSLYNEHKFDFILTYYQELLESSSIYRFAPYGGVWIPFSDWGLYPKTKNISMLFGAKRSTEGHLLRHEIYETFGENAGIDYYGFRGTPTDYGGHTKLRVLADYRYSIVIETCRENGLFTEILLDCFAVGTIPIFWGAPDIADYFNQFGIHSFTDIDDLKDILSVADEENYLRRSYSIGNNLNKVREYAITEDWLYMHHFEGLS